MRHYVIHVVSLPSNGFEVAVFRDTQKLGETLYEDQYSDVVRAVEKLVADTLSNDEGSNISIQHIP